MDQSKHRAISSTEEEYFTVFKEIMRTWVKQVQRQREVTHKLPEFEPKFDWLLEHVTQVLKLNPQSLKTKVNLPKSFTPNSELYRCFLESVI